MQRSETPSPEEVQDQYGQFAEMIGDGNPDVVAGLKKIFGNMAGGGTPDEIGSFLRTQEAHDREWLTGEILRLDEEARRELGINREMYVRLAQGLAEVERGLTGSESDVEPQAVRQPVRERAPQPQPSTEPAFGTEQA
jgi:hypothetical protein